LINCPRTKMSAHASNESDSSRKCHHYSDTLLAELKRRHPTATTEAPGLDRRQDVDFCQAVDDFERWLATTPSENGTAELLGQLRTLASFYADGLTPTPTFKRLWQLAQTP